MQNHYAMLRTVCNEGCRTPPDDAVDSLQVFCSETWSYLELRLSVTNLLLLFSPWDRQLEIWQQKPDLG